MARLTRNAAAVLLTVVLTLALACDAHATPIPDQCKDPVFARANTQLCDLTSNPFGVGGSGGHGGGLGGLLHTLTGGLL
jgi:hypothetical protein